MDKNMRILGYVDGFAIHKDTQSILIRDGDPSLVPTMSIMIPTYKRPALLREAVASALAQNVTTPFEVVVVDNDADPAHAEVERALASFNAPNLRLYRNQSNIGMFGNWNRCIELARGSWLTILNDDDLLDPSFLSHCEQILGSNPSVKLVACSAAVRDERCGGNLPRSRARLYGGALKKLVQLISPQLTQLSACDYFVGNPHYGSLGILFDRESAIHMGGINPEAYPSADFVFFINFQSRYPGLFTKAVLATYRISKNESLRPEIVERFVAQSVQIRKEMAYRLPLPRSLCRLYSQWLAVDIENTYRDIFGVIIQRPENHIKAARSARSVYWRIRSMKVFLKLWCAISSRFFSVSAK